MTIVGPTEFTYPGYSAEAGKALLWLDEQERVAAVLDPPSNPGTSVTNAVEAVIDELRSAYGEDLRIFTVALSDPIIESASFEVGLHAGQPAWTPVTESSDPPEAVRLAQRHARELRALIDVDEDGPRTPPSVTLSADEPISEFSEDLLGRADFARAVLEDIRQAPRGAGFVLAVTGEWGEGKTSVLNLMSRELDSGEDAVVVKFNPWLFSGAEQLVDHFFEELQGQLQASNAPRLAAIASSLEAYGRLVRPLRDLPYLGELIATSGNIAEEAARSMTGGLGSASAQAARLRKELSELDTPIVVVVDDLDRLQSAEILDVMRLVRLVGDFPNLVYLLAFDRRRVEEALGQEDPEKGRAYLEKMVQVMHSLPPVAEETLTKALLREIDSAVGDVDAYQFDRDAFQAMFWSGFRRLFRNIRDVRRFVNVLPATLQLLGDEVELSDVLALEAIRLFAPDAFDVLRNAPAAFTTTNDVGRSYSRSDDHKDIVLSMIRVAEAQGATIDAMVRELFPAAERHLGGSNYGSDWLGSWRRDRRVASPEVLDIYLRRRVPEGGLAARDVDAIFQALEDEETLDGLLQSLDATELEQALARLQSYETDFPRVRPEVTLTVLSRHGQRLPKGMRHFMDFGAGVELSRVMYRLLKGLEPDEAERAVEAADFATLSTRFEVVRIVGHREGSGHRLVPEDVAERLEEDLADAIVNAESDAMASEQDLGPLIRLALDRRGDEARRVVGKWSKDDRFFLALLQAYLMISLGHTLGRAGVRRTLQLNWPALVEVLGFDFLASRVGEIDPRRLSETLSDDGAEAWRQASYYVRDPAAGERDALRWPDRDDEDE